jgi:hypothetical protein
MKKRGKHIQLTRTEERCRRPREEVRRKRAVRVRKVRLRPAVPRERRAEFRERARAGPREERGYRPYDEARAHALRIRDYHAGRRAVTAAGTNPSPSQRRKPRERERKHKKKKSKNKVKKQRTKAKQNRRKFGIHNTDKIPEPIFLFPGWVGGQNTMSYYPISFIGGW